MSGVHQIQKQNEQILAPLQEVPRVEKSSSVTLPTSNATVMQTERQRVTPIGLNHAQGRETVKMCCAAFGTPTLDRLVIGFMLSVMRNVGEIYRTGARSLQQPFRQARHQHRIHHRFQLNRLVIIHQQRFHGIPNRVGTGRVLQQATRGFDRGLLHGSGDQYIPDIAGFIVTATHVQFKILLQHGARQLIHVVRGQSLRCSRLITRRLVFPIAFGKRKGSQMVPFFNPCLSVAVY